MAWVTRGEKSYYYASVRVGGRPTKVYRGSGAEAEQAAAGVERRKAERAEQAERLRLEGQRHQAADHVLATLCDQADALLAAALTAAGYHRHDRGSWRRKRCR